MMWPRGAIHGIGTPEGEATASDGDFPRSAKAGQDCNAVPDVPLGAGKVCYYENATHEVINANHEAIGNKALAFVGTSGVQLGWLASQADMLADDWLIVE